MTPEAVAATLRAFVQASGALSASALVEAGTIDVEADGSASLEPPDSPVAEPLDADGAEPLPLGVALTPAPPFDVNAATGEVGAPFGVLEAVARGVRELAAALGGRSVVVVRLPVLDEQTPFAIAAREGDGLVVVIGEEQYAMAEGWPDDGATPPPGPSDGG